MKEDRTVSQNFSSNLKYWCEKRNLTLKDLSGITGISVDYLYRLENAARKAPSLPMLVEIASALDIPIITLLEGTI